MFSCQDAPSFDYHVMTDSTSLRRLKLAQRLLHEKLGQRYENSFLNILTCTCNFTSPNIHFTSTERTLREG